MVIRRVRNARACSASGKRAGFTLFEVMAASAVLGLFVTVLASASIQGVSAEGRARETLDASLRADQILARIEESSVRFQAAPEPYEGEEDPYYVRVIGPLPHPISGQLDPSLVGFTIEVWNLDQTQLLAQRNTYAFDIGALEEQLDEVGLLGEGETLGGTLGAGAPAPDRNAPPAPGPAAGADADAGA